MDVFWNVQLSAKHIQKRMSAAFIIIIRWKNCVEQEDKVLDRITFIYVIPDLK